MRTFIIALVSTLGLSNALAQGADLGKSAYESGCAACHGSGVLGAPKFGDKAAWAVRSKRGLDALVKSAIAGTAKGMPPRGGRSDFSDMQLRAAIEHMMSGGVVPAASRKTTAPPPTAAARPVAPVAAAASRPVAPAAAAAAAPPQAPVVVAAAPPPPAAEPAVTGGAVAIAPPPPTNAAAAAEVNSFNRLFRPRARFNRPAAESGIHDPENDMTLQLQPPATAFVKLPRSMAGNYVNWGKALEDHSITPRWDRNDPSVAAIVMDLNIVREVKGSMPDVVYPHKQHTEWLDCSNCHPKVFLPQKGANQISMAAILLGQKCGVCHGKVAFPVSECRLCHSRKKTLATAAEGPKQ